MAKRAIDSGTQGRKNQVLKRPIDLTGINKVPILGKCPVGKCPSSHHRQVTKLQISDYIENIKRDAASPAEVLFANNWFHETRNFICGVVCPNIGHPALTSSFSVYALCKCCRHATKEINHHVRKMKQLQNGLSIHNCCKSIFHHKKITFFKWRS